MDSDNGNSLCSSCTGKNCGTAKCQQCHSVKSFPLERLFPRSPHHQDTAGYADSACNSGNSSSSEDQDKVRASNKNASFGFNTENKRTVDPSPAGVNGKHVTAHYGEVTPEDQLRTKRPTQDCRLSPHMAHIHSADASSRHEYNVQAHGHHHGNVLRSDAYLRQALTSPYNQRGGGERYVASTASTSSPWGHKEVQGSPCWERGARRGLLDGCRSRAGEHQDTAAAAAAAQEHMVIFKTPLKSIRRAMFSSPDRAKQGELGTVSRSCSPSSSGSSSSGGGGAYGSGPHHNPFEACTDRLHFPTFSPNMFNILHTPGSTEEKFHWNIEHLAELRPVHIDEKDIRRQLSRQCYDEELERRAQRAIDYYFQHHMVAPSPWSEAPPPHVLPTTPCGPYYELLGATPDQTEGSIQKDLPRSRKYMDKTCQTVLTIPSNLDLENVLGEYMTYQETDKDDSISSTSLRRKLFFNADSSSILSPVRSSEKSPDDLAAALHTPPDSKSTPQWEGGSLLHTPSSVQFSSSPIRGQLHEHGDYLRTSFQEHGPLASPELSPIADRHQGRFRQSLGFPSLEDDGEGEGGPEFGSPVCKQLQMEVHNGSSPRGRPSPDVSPIATFGSGGSGHHSRSHTLRAEADMSQSILSPPLHPSPAHNPHLAFSSPSPYDHPSPDFAELAKHAGRTQRTSISMDTDAGEILLKDAGILTCRDLSMTEEMSGGEGGTSSLDTDTLQNPSSISYPDTGYQTGSGNGSLQTTQEGAVSLTTNTSTDTGAWSSQDCAGGQQKKVLTSRLQHTGGDQGGPSDGKMRRPWVDDSSVDEAGGSSFRGDSGLHSNLTSQLLSLPFLQASELSIDDGSCSLPPHHLPTHASHRLTSSSSCSTLQDLLTVGQGRASYRNFPLNSDFSSSTGHIFPCVSQRSVSIDPSSLVHEKKVSDRPEDKAISIRPGQLFAGSRKGSVSDDGSELVQAQDTAGSQLTGDGCSSQRDRALTEDEAESYIHRHDANFLHRMGEYLLQTGGDPSSDEDGGGGFTEAGAGQKAALDTNYTSQPFWLSDAGGDDSVVERARQYLASVNYSGSEDVGATVHSVLDLVPQSRLSTPAKKLLGKVAGDLTSAGRSTAGASPALASEVAKELMRRAEMDLKRLRYPRSNSRSGTN